MPFPFDPAPTVLWTLSVDGKLASCEVRFVPIGVEARRDAGWEAALLTHLSER